MRFLPLIVLFFCVSATSDTILWQDQANQQPSYKNLVSGGRTLVLDPSSLDIILSAVNNASVVAKRTAKRKAQSFENTTPIIMPLPDGSEVSVNIEETQVMSAELSSKFPNIKTYRLSGMDHPNLTGNMNISQQGVFVTLRKGKGERVFIEPDRSDVSDQYISFWEGNATGDHKTHSCSLSEGHEEHDVVDNSAVNNSAFVDNRLQARSSAAMNSNLMTYRIAISATRSYMAANGGTKSGAMRAIASTINRINEVYKRDAGVRFVLVGNNDRLIAPSSEFSGSLANMLKQNQKLVDREVGSNNYDVGHLFTARGGGLAYVSSACRNGLKAMGLSGNLSVGKERYALEFVAHEIGHQLGATHTFNSNEGLCTANNRSSSSAYEPGSGSTIMSYIGICGSDNLQYHADAMFHIGSIQQIINHKKRYYGKGCGILSSSNNSAPVVNAGADYNIPANTPFELKGSARDGDNDSLLYNWQQQDAGKASRVNVDTGNNALFRSFLPTKAKHRSFPSMGVLNGTKRVKGETLPQTDRLMHFKFIAHDSAGATASDSMTVRVIADGGAFRVDPLPKLFVPGQKAKVTWQVADTHLPPISCAAVNIALSVDKGHHFSHILATEVENSGSAIVTIPDAVVDKDNVRLKLSCSDSIFFSISSGSSKAQESTADVVRLSGSASSTSVTAIKNQLGGAGGSFSGFWLWLLGMGLVLGRYFFSPIVLHIISSERKRLS